MPQVDYLQQYQQLRDVGDKELRDKSAYSSAIAEMLGYYTPELQQQTLAPLGYNPTVAENLISAPVRGLGKLFGSEKMQQVGAPRAFQMPTEGAPSKTNPVLEMMSRHLGVSVPTEQSPAGPPRLRTAWERGEERANQQQMIEMMKWVADKQQSEKEYQLNKLKADAMIKESEANIRKIDQDIKEGPPLTEARLLADELKRTGMTLLDFKTRIAAVNNQPSAQMQAAAEVAKQYKISNAEAIKLMKMWESNPMETAYKLAGEEMSNFDKADPNASEKIRTRALEIVKDFQWIMEQQVPQPKKDSIPQDLSDSGVSEEHVTTYIQKYNVSRDEAVQMIREDLEDYKKQNAKPASPSKPKSK